MYIVNWKCISKNSFESCMSQKKIHQALSILSSLPPTTSPPLSIPINDALNWISLYLEHLLEQVQVIEPCNTGLGFDGVDVVAPLQQILISLLDSGRQEREGIGFSAQKKDRSGETYPRTSSPPASAHPNIAVLLHIAQHALDGSIALRVVASSKFAQVALLVVRNEPLSGLDETFLADGRRDALRAGTGAVRVEILVHFVDDVVQGIGEVLHVVVDLRPGPGSRVGVALHEDGLAGACRADAVDGGLVEADDQ